MTTNQLPPPSAHPSHIHPSHTHPSSTRPMPPTSFAPPAPSASSSFTPDPVRDRVPLTPTEQRTWAAVAHASTVVALLLSVGSASFLGPLLVWAIKKDDPFVRESAARAFNFNVVLAGLNLVAWVLLFTVILSPIAVLLFLAAGAMTLWFHTRAALAAHRGEMYTYPWQVQLIR